MQDACGKYRVAPAGEEILAAITELNEIGQRPISLMTSKWHYFHFMDGREELYNWKNDPGERHEVSGEPQFRDTAKAMHSRLVRMARESLGPWFGPDYLFGLNDSDYDFVTEGGPPDYPALKDLKSGPRRVGAMQALFMDPDDQSASRLPHEKQKLLKSLPYQ
jgi:hypothetical protein